VRKHNRPAHSRRAKQNSPVITGKIRKSRGKNTKLAMWQSYAMGIILLDAKNG
jgi:hypothetical protein